MRSFIVLGIRKILGIDDTELPEKQVKYLRDIANTSREFMIDDANLIMFIDSIKDKHGIQDISLFRKGIAIFSSEKDDLEKVTKYHDLFENFSKMSDKKIMLIKDKYWINIFEKENFVFIVKRPTKLNEIEIGAIAYDTLKRLDKILLEERTVLENAFQYSFS